MGGHPPDERSDTPHPNGERGAAASELIPCLISTAALPSFDSTNKQVQCTTHLPNSSSPKSQTTAFACPLGVPYPLL